MISKELKPHLILIFSIVDVVGFSSQSLNKQIQITYNILKSLSQGFLINYLIFCIYEKKRLINNALLLY